MANDVKSYNENLVGRRVKLWFSKDKSFCEGVVSSHGNAGKNLVVCTDGAEEILNVKKIKRETVKDVSGDQGTETCYPAHTSSHILPEMDASKAYDEEFIGCKLKVWRPKSKTFSEGVVASYNHSLKKYLVVYSNGVEEMLDLRKQIGTAEDDSADQAQKAHSPARGFSSMHACDDDMDSHMHAGKKHKGQPIDMDFKLSPIPNDAGVQNVSGYKIRTTSAPLLEAIFTKYGDISACCIYKSPSVRASLLEVICNVVQRLQYDDIEAILSDLEVIKNEVSDVEASKIQVSWLNEHLKKLHKIAASREKYIELTTTKVKSGIITKACIDELEERRAELLLAQERFKEAEKRVDAMKLVSEKIDEDIMEFESEEYFWRRRLGELL